MAAEDNFVLLYGGKNFAVEIGAYMGDLWVFSTTDATWCSFDTCWIICKSIVSWRSLNSELY